MAKGRGELDAQFFQPLLGAGPDSPRIISALPFRVVLMFISFSKLALEMRPEWRRLNCNDLDSSGYAQRQTTQRSQASRTRNAMKRSDQKLED